MNEIRRSALKWAIATIVVMAPIWVYVASFDVAGTKPAGGVETFLVALLMPAFLVLVRSLWELVTGKKAPYPLQKPEASLGFRIKHRDWRERLERGERGK